VVELTMIVVATSGVAGFLRAMRGLGFPALLVTTMQFALRYLAVIADEAQRMMRARDLRGRPRRLRDRARVAGAIIGTLFLRSSARAARVAQAMAARGFTGDMPTFRLPPVSAADECVCVLVVVFFWAVQAAGYRGWWGGGSAGG
jgi:cobalt/nickel transport system permease protein